ncbi:MAG TPA: DcaP family trimeric outer membrane transporter [Burkholderiaceae bacterium]|nr:DcaP family trimeric outer membrane transporter [Burkholderiaceae bacterium]
MRRQAIAAAAALAVCGGAHAQSTTDELKAALDQAMRTIQDLQSRVRSLEEQQKAKAPAAAAAPAPAGAAAPVSAPGAAADAKAPDGDKARVEIYGQAMADAIYDFKKMNPQWAATLRPSQIPIACPGSPGCGEDGQFTFSIRQSSLGVRGFIPTDYGLIKTDLAFDLFGSDGGTNIHWLRAWAEMGMYGVGQYDSNFMDISVFPNTIDYWGPPGMVFVRTPQFRVTPYKDLGMTVAVSLEAPNSAIDTGKITDVDPSLGAGIQGKNKLPDLVGSIRYEGDWGHVRAATILRQVGFHNTASADGEPANEKTGYGINLSGTWKVFGFGQLNWQAVTGKAIASYMNDGGIDLAPNASLQAETVRSQGYLIYYNHNWSDKFTSAIGYSQHKQSNTEGQFGTAFRRGSYGSLNVLYQLNKNMMTGGEYIWGKNETKDGASATDARMQWSTRVTF